MLLLFCFFLLFIFFSMRQYGTSFSKYSVCFQTKRHFYFGLSSVFFFDNLQCAWFFFFSFLNEKKKVRRIMCMFLVLSQKLKKKHFQQKQKKSQFFFQKFILLNWHLCFGTGKKKLFFFSKKKRTSINSIKKNTAFAWWGWGYKKKNPAVRPNYNVFFFQKHT